MVMLPTRFQHFVEFFPIKCPITIGVKFPYHLGGYFGCVHVRMMNGLTRILRGHLCRFRNLTGWGGVGLRLLLHSPLTVVLYSEFNHGRKL